MAANAAIFVTMKKETIITTICILFIAAFAFFGLPMFKPRMAQQSTQPFWETSLSTDQDVQVFGLTLNQSSLKDAIDTFGNRLAITLYETEDGDQIEGYFRETQVGPFIGRMAFRLNSNPDNMALVKTKLEVEKAPMSRNFSYKITPDLNELFINDSLFSLAFIPVQIVLTPNDVKGRFGEPTLIIEETENDKKTGTVHYLYPEKGIDVTLDKEKRSIIQYVSPRFFEEKIIAPLTHKD